MTAARTIQERVAAGAAALDAYLPGWVDRVDLGTLDMRSPCGCILGQAFDNYWTAPFGDPYDDPERYRADLGFQAYSTLDGGSGEPGEYAALQDEWARLIEARRAEAGAR